MRTIKKALAPYKVTRPISPVRILTDDEVQNGLCWVSDAVSRSHLRGALGYQASRHFAHDVLPDEFWKGVKEEREGMTEGK